MSKVDDELTRRLRRAERPVDDDDLFEGLARRRAHRERLHRVQAGLVAFAVLAATAGGFMALREAFESDEEGPAVSPSPAMLASNGEIVFVKDGKDLRLHIYASQSDGTEVRQLTEGNGHDSHPAVSPDGRAIAFSHDLPDENVAEIATISIDGGPITWRSDRYPDVGEPAWSPDGTRISFVGYGVDRADLYVADLGTDQVRRIPLPGDGDATQAHPSWSPDGSRIAIALDWDILIVGPDGSDPRWVVETIDTAEFAPAWSPDGTRIAFLSSNDPEGIATDEVLPNEIRTIAPDGGSTTLIAIAPDADLGLDLDWAPDGTALLVSDLDWIYRVDPTPDDDPSENFVQIIRGFAPSWQPLPAGSTPSTTPSPEPEGRDIGLGFNLCHAERLGGIDFLGDGTRGQAWIGAPPKEDGTCTEFAKSGKFMVAVDHTGDQLADSWIDLPWQCYNGCALADATDLDANGSEELIVQGYFSIMDYWVLAVRPNDADEMVLEPILVASPGHEPASITAGEPLRVDAGGDAGYSSVIWCDGYPDDPVIVWAWVYGQVETEQPKEVHITRLQLQPDGLIHVIGTNDYTIPASEDWGYGDRSGPGCGVDWNYWG